MVRLSIVVQCVITTGLARVLPVAWLGATARAGVARLTAKTAARSLWAFERMIDLLQVSRTACAEEDEVLRPGGRPQYKPLALGLHPPAGQVNGRCKLTSANRRGRGVRGSGRRVGRELGPAVRGRLGSPLL